MTAERARQAGPCVSVHEAQPGGKVAILANKEMAVGGTCIVQIVVTHGTEEGATGGWSTNPA
jgi:hypothetical protein